MWSSSSAGVFRLFAIFHCCAAAPLCFNRAAHRAVQKRARSAALAREVDAGEISINIIFVMHFLLRNNEQ